MGFGNASDSTNRMTHGGKSAHQPKQDGCGGLFVDRFSPGTFNMADAVGLRAAAVADEPGKRAAVADDTEIKTRIARRSESDD